MKRRAAVAALVGLALTACGSDGAPAAGTARPSPPATGGQPSDAGLEPVAPTDSAIGVADTPAGGDPAAPSTSPSTAAASPATDPPAPADPEPAASPATDPPAPADSEPAAAPATEVPAIAPAVLGGRTLGPVLSAASDTPTNPLPDLVVDDVRRGTAVNLRNVFPAERPVLLWFWAPH